MRHPTRNKLAVVLLSGGLDSTTTLFLALNKGFEASCLIFDYGQRHKREVEGAKKIARWAHCAYRIEKLALVNRGSSLLDKKIKVPVAKFSGKIPSTYVPARNLIFLSIASSFAESLGAEAIFIGANAIDFSGYPDCRPEFYSSLQRVLDVGTKSGVEGKGIKIITPLINRTKKEIVLLGAKLGVPFNLTWSCYKGGKRPCGKCESCFLRDKGFKEAGLKDPLKIKYEREYNRTDK